MAFKSTISDKMEHKKLVYKQAMEPTTGGFHHAQDWAMNGMNSIINASFFLRTITHCLGNK